MKEWTFQKYDHLQDAVKRFFEILDIKEESDMGGPSFHPNKMDFKNRCITSCRVYNTAELESIFKQMKTLSGYQQAKEMQEWDI